MKTHRFIFAAIATLLVASVGNLWAQAGEADIPNNAYKRPYGSGWDCIWGDQKGDNVCSAIKKPETAYLTAYGAGWKCNRGFLKNRDVCVVVNVPVYAYLVDAQYLPGLRV